MTTETQPIAPTFNMPYYAVIFTSTRTHSDQGYATTAQRMLELAARQPGFLGAESARGADGVGITVSYWRDPASIRAWKAESEHRLAQATGRSTWYRAYAVRVARVERDYARMKRPGPSAEQEGADLGFQA